MHLPDDGLIAGGGFAGGSGIVEGAMSYTFGMTQRVGAKGQVVIPKPIRDELGLKPGAAVEFQRDGDAVRVTAAGGAAAAGLKGRYRSSGLADALLAERAREPR